MTPNHGTDTPEDTGLGDVLERLRKQRPTSQSYLYGWVGTEPINPDGPEAADLIEAYLATLPIPQGSTASGDDVERVARAICLNQDEDPDATYPVPPRFPDWRGWQQWAGAARAALAALPTRTPDGDLLGVLESVKSWLQTAPLESGYCCCGSPVESHGMGDGHSPVDELAYSAGQQIEMIDAAISKAHGHHGEGK